MNSRLKLLSERFKTSEFIRNSLVMITGTGIAQLIPVLIIPVLTRLYTPAEIGILATFVSLFTIFFVLAGGRYEYAIIMPESDRVGARLFQIASGLCLLTGLFFLVIVFFSGNIIARWLDVSVLEPWLWLLPLTITAQGLFMTFSFSLNRYKHYPDIARGKVSQSSSTAIIQIAGGLLGWGFAGLIIGKVVGIVLSSLWLFVAVFKKARHIFQIESFEDLKKTASEYNRYPKFNAPLALLNGISNNLPVLLFITFFTDVIAGFYAMAIRICSAPVQIISAAIGQVIGRRLAEIYHEKKDVRKYVIKILTHLLIIGLVPFGLLFIAGPIFFGFLLGSDWAVIGYYIRILTPYVYLTFVTQPLSYLPLLYNQQKKTLGIYTISLVLRFLGILIGVWMNIFYVSLFLYSLTGVAVSLYYIYWYLSICNNPSNDPTIIHT